MLAFRRSTFGQAERDGIAQRGTDHGVGDTGVAAGGVQNCFAGMQIAAENAFANHGQRGAIFYGAAGIEPFGLRVKFNIFKFTADASQAQQRSIADAVE